MASHQLIFPGKSSFFLSPSKIESEDISADDQLKVILEILGK